MTHEFPAYLPLVHGGIPSERSIRSHSKTRGTKATLPAIIGHKSVQQWTEICPFSKALNRGDLTPTHLHGQEMTGTHRSLIHQNRTSAALTTITGPFRPYEIELIPQHIQQGHTVLNLNGVRLSIDL
jgi:hypothetical protein